MVSVQPQDSSVKDDDEVPYSSSDEEETIVVIRYKSTARYLTLAQSHKIALKHSPFNRIAIVVFVKNQRQNIRNH